MSGTIAVRRARPEDAPALCDLSLRAIRGSAAAHYSTGQLEAWAARRTVEGHEWMLRNTHVLLAEADGELAGFCSVALRPVGALRAGEVDQAFVAPAQGGRGVARALLTQVAADARAAGLTRLLTHASWRAVPVFERLGYRRVRIETVDLDGVALTRVLMDTDLG
ncbi:GNAT family N-acetyltransferase [Geodermatophilus amargosae]|uniref:GNAT family N-acetyltransferase n=1 Tax=Geodermatophilus amargosae TaxID=1296565 RepID=UPI0034DF5D41